MTDPYLLLKWIHVLSATVLFGTGLGTALHMWLSHLSGDVRAIAVATRNTVRVDWLCTLPSGLVQPLSGLGLARLAGYDLGESWLVLSYLLYLIAGICWIVVVRLQIRARDLAAKAAAFDAELPPAYHAAMTAWFWLGWPAFIGLIVVFGLMVAKPALW